MIQIALTLLLFLALVVPLGRYLYRLTTAQKVFADRFFLPIENFLTRICRLPKESMSWQQYALALLLTNFLMVLLGYGVLRLQPLLFLNPNHVGAMESSLSFNTLISFITNTNLQHYAGEDGLSHLSQMLVIIYMMFTSAATGYAACAAFVRGLFRMPMGNFYQDMLRITLRVLLPISLLSAIFLCAQGVPQTLSSHLTVRTIEGAYQDIAVGPVASLETIKHLGTNGGGFFGANSSTPMENPTILTNLVELLLMMLMPGACVVMFGHMKHAAKESSTGASSRSFAWLPGESKSLFVAMSILFLGGLALCWFSESAGNPALAKMGLSQAMGSMEGKEVRFGISQSVLFSTVTTSFTTGTVNNMHDTLTPLGGLVPLLHMMLNVVFGGIGVGLMNMVIYAILAVFLCGLMIGRTPEYLGKKIEGQEMQLTTLSILLHPLLILGFSALAVSLAAGRAGITNPGSHGLSQVLYEYASSAANNGSGFEGLSDNTFFWNVSTGLAMYLGRYLAIVLQLAIAGSLFAKRAVSESADSLRTDTFTFSFILVGIVLIFAALTFLPALSLGPISEQLTLWK